MNIHELSLGSFVKVNLRIGIISCQVTGINEEKITVKVLDNFGNGSFSIGEECSFFHGYVTQWDIDKETLMSLGFIESDKKGWDLLYWFGDIKLYYRYDVRNDTARFRMTSIYQKRFTSIECHGVHRLQNIMLFLTGGELVFDYIKK